MRLTDHLEKGSVFTLDEITAGKCYKKLSQLEDIMEKYELNDVDNLDLILSSYFNAITKLLDKPQLLEELKELAKIEDELRINILLYLKVMKNQVVYVKGKEPEWADNGTKKDIVKYCVVRFTAEELVVRFNKDCSEHVIAKPLNSHGKTWALTKEELL